MPKTTTFAPRFSEADGLGHINNCVIPSWFEWNRNDVFKVFIPDLNLKKWKLIVLKVTVEYKAQITYEQSVTVETSISKIGTTSFTVLQKVFQNEILCAEGETIMVKFDYNDKKSTPISNQEKMQLENF